MDKLKIAIVKPIAPKDANTVRAIITDEVYEDLKQVVEKSGIALSQLTGKMIEFALKNIEYVEF